MNIRNFKILEIRLSYAHSYSPKQVIYRFISRNHSAGVTLEPYTQTADRRADHPNHVRR